MAEKTVQYKCNNTSGNLYHPCVWLQRFNYFNSQLERERQSDRYNICTV